MPRNRGNVDEAVVNGADGSAATAPQEADQSRSMYAEFNRELKDNVISEALETGLSRDEIFFDSMTERLEAVGELEVAERAAFYDSMGNKTVRIDGSGGDPRDADGILSIIVCDFHSSPDPTTVNAQDARRLFGYLVNFLSYAKSAALRANLAAGSPASGLAEIIAEAWDAIVKIKLILITNAIYSARTDAAHAGTIAGIPTTYNIWDLSRFHRYESAGQMREDLEINFQRDYGGSVPAIHASKNGNDLESYLMVIPGTQLANIYDKWGSRILESNIRSFLQARGKVNQGIRDTIVNDPAMFFSYNNGIAATADSVETEAGPNGLAILSAKNLQIVNGGQTTASLHAARRVSAASLSDVRVQMKLTVVPTERSSQVVPRIAEYANSQNKVSVADFFSNHPFHIRVEEYSRRVLAPAVEGTNRETKWFYERARGQYLVERAKRSITERRRFDIEFPKAQLFTKTDLAKIEFSFLCKPDTVSKGAQKNFGEFSKYIGSTWPKNDGQFDETWYRRLISKVLIFRYLEKTVPKQPWYPGGYRANIVTYAISKLVADAEEMKMLIDLDTVWRGQQVIDSLGGALLMSAEKAAQVLMTPILGIKNITEWAKKQACWENLRQHKIDYGPSLRDCLIAPEEAKQVQREGRRAEAELSGIEAQTKVVTDGAEYWSRLRAWGAETGNLSVREDGILKACAMVPMRLPSERQCIAAIEILQKARSLGYSDENEAVRVKIGSWNRHH
ncbi:hypothetical protein CF68_23465 [Cupriavidus sp. SK-4]|uniref:AIPR family protein n=1 Tax=Cupriavidus sp. SK-4 TaxID=574750 RepID=UPI0004495603|nr:AIPR family protein [Cupriavidus sp. SK-4]EYS95372.1 hypothetical protein CF68_23465 [Cupriavidus sp. SK-4]